jgi:hypothetical protein
MKSMQKTIVSVAIMLIVIMAVIPDANAQRRARIRTPKGTVRLVYNYPENIPLHYKSTTNVIQDMDINGQSMQANVNFYLGCVITGRGNEDNTQKLEISVDSMEQNVDSPNGAYGGPVKEAVGKKFTMTISSQGKVIDISEAEKIVFDIEGSGESNLSQSFYNYFPALPDRDLKPGDTWESNDSTVSAAPTNTTKVIAKSVNSFEGIENIDGIDCAKIVSTITGTREQTMQSMGMEIFISGPFTGTVEIYFAVKEGYYIKQVAKTRMDGTIELRDQGMSFPVVMNVDGVTQLIK